MRQIVRISLLSLSLIGLVRGHEGHEDGDVYEDHDLEQKCASAISKFCRDVPAGDDRVRRCLLDHVYVADMPSECKEALIRSAISIARDQTGGMGGSSMRERLCEDEIERRGGSSEFGCSSTDAVSLKIECVIRKFPDLKDPQCKSEVFEVIKERAMDIRLDPAAWDACRSDKERYCDDVSFGKGRVRSCLRLHFSELADTCRKLEFAAAVRESTDARLKSEIHFACISDIQRFCSDSTTFSGDGDGSTVACLRKNREQATMSPECRDAVIVDARIASLDMELNPRAHKACASDIHRICYRKEIKMRGKRNGEIAACLAENMDAIRSDSCREALNSILADEADDVRLDPEVKTACSGDLKKFCANVEPGMGRAHACLRKNIKALTQECRLKEFKQEQRENTNFQFKVILRRACAKDVRSLCADVTPGEGRVINCLQDRRDSDDMSDSCKHALLVDMVTRNDDITFKTGLYKACKPHVARLCEAEMNLHAQHVNGNAVEALFHNGGVVSCLIKHRDEIEEDSLCSKALFREVTQRDSDVRLDPDAETHCVSDIQRLCGTVPSGKGRVGDCLQKNLQRIKDTDCRRATFQRAVSIGQSVDRMRGVKRSCRREIATGPCQDSVVDPRGGDTFRCLLDIATSQRSGEISEACTTAVLEQAEANEKNFFEVPSLAKACDVQAKKLCGDVYVSAERGNQTGALIECLVANRDFVDDSGDASCLTEIDEQIAIRAADIRLDAFADRACAKDEAKFCRRIPRRVGRSRKGAVHACLRSHFNDLSDACRRSEFIQDRGEQSNILTFPGIKLLCRREVREICANRGVGFPVDREILRQCLVENIANPQMSASCRKAIERAEADQSRDIRLSPAMAKHCQLDIKKMSSCHVDSLTHFFGAVDAIFGRQFNFPVKYQKGRIENCLVERYAKIRNEKCKRDVMKYAVDEVRLPSRLPNFNKYCEGEIEEYCESKSGSKLTECMLSASDKMDPNGLCKRSVLPPLKARLILKNEHDRETAQLVREGSEKDTAASSGVVLRGGVAFAALASLVILSIGVTVFLWRAISRSNVIREIVVNGLGSSKSHRYARVHHSARD